MLLDFDPRVVGIASQPFVLVWRSGRGRAPSHVPDYFARRADSSSVVIDCRPEERRPERDAVKFAATAEVCGRLGWAYRLLGDPDRVLPHLTERPTPPALSYLPS